MKSYKGQHGKTERKAFLMEVKPFLQRLVSKLDKLHPNKK